MLPALGAVVPALSNARTSSSVTWMRVLKWRTLRRFAMTSRNSIGLLRTCACAGARTGGNGILILDDARHGPVKAGIDEPPSNSRREEGSQEPMSMNNQR